MSNNNVMKMKNPILK